MKYMKKKNHLGSKYTVQKEFCANYIHYNIVELNVQYCFKQLLHLNSIYKLVKY